MEASLIDVSGSPGNRKTIKTRNVASALVAAKGRAKEETLRVFGHGVKVAVEISMEACDAGLIPEGEVVIVVAGTGRGADTVVVLEPHPSNRFLNVKVRQILAKPF